MRRENYIYFVLILLALVIVTTSKVIFKDENQINSSYPTPISAYDDRSEPVEIVPQSEVPVGTKIDEYKGVAVTDYMSTHGLSFSDDGYYYGYKWQCVEYVKRFYYEKYDHMMSDGAGHAKYFFNPMLEQGQLNEQRGLFQYHNGGDVQPQVDDLLVFDDGAYGHVAIISEIGDGWLEVIQQNSEVPRERYTLTEEDGEYNITGEKKAAGWLRI